MKWLIGAGAGLVAMLFGSKAAAAPNAPAPQAPAKPTDPFFAWDTLIRRFSDSYDVPFLWMKAIMMNESDLGRAASVRRGLANPNDIQGSKSSDGKSWGLMQLTLGTARMFESGVTESDLNDPETSVRLAAKYLKYLMGKTPSPYTQEEFVIRAYNGGPGFRGTVAGQRDTPAYYAKWKSNAAKVKERQAV